MNLATCKQCGRLFNYVSGPCLCNLCSNESEHKLQTVKEYLRQHPDAQMTTILQENNISSSLFKEWIHEERLVLPEGSPIVSFICENCGTPIKTGRMCDSCKSRLNNSSNSALDYPKPR